MSELRESIAEELRARIRKEMSKHRGDSFAETAAFSALFEQLPRVIDAIGRVRDYSIEPYREQTCKAVCEHCAVRQEKHCSGRMGPQCPLDRYLTTLVATIERKLYET